MHQCKSAPATGAISSPTAQASFGANIGAHELAAWADRVGVPAHTTEAQAKSNAMAAKGRLRRAGRSGPDDTERPTGQCASAASVQGPATAPRLPPRRPSASRSHKGQPRPSHPPDRAEARGRIREAIAMQRAYEDDNGTPTDRATFNLQRRQARQADHTSAPAMSPRESVAFNQANQHFEQNHLQVITHLAGRRQVAHRTSFPRRPASAPMKVRHPGGTTPPTVAIPRRRRITSSRKAGSDAPA